MHVYYRCYKRIMMHAYYIHAYYWWLITRSMILSLCFFVVESKWLFNWYYVLVLCNRAKISFQSWFSMFLSSIIKLDTSFNLFLVLKFFLCMFPLFGHFYHAKTNAMFFKKLRQCWLKLCNWTPMVMVVKSCTWKVMEMVVRL